MLKRLPIRPARASALVTLQGLQAVSFSPAPSTSSQTSHVAWGATMSRARERSSVFAFAAFVIAAFAGVAFAVGYLVGRILL